MNLGQVVSDMLDMERLLKIDGMTCMNCFNNVKEKLMGIPEVLNEDVQLEYPQASI